VYARARVCVNGETIQELVYYVNYERRGEEIMKEIYGNEIRDG